ncbi:MAG TPA: hypothetical protein VK689_01295, partial [Armatimonadota bacterium]|nr:hypothetical protein [Armatimonadota bacterium]
MNRSNWCASVVRGSITAGVSASRFTIHGLLEATSPPPRSSLPAARQEGRAAMPRSGRDWVEQNWTSV